jgi:CRISPR system Cascade subunit CasA
LWCSGIVTLQINAPSGGAGHRTGLRGGGPLTTLLLGDNLWETIWHNVLLKDSLGKETGNPECVAESKLFPWLDATVTSEKGSTPIQWVSHPPEHVFWGMPRRIRLSMEQAAEPVTCHLCDDVCQTIIKQYRTRNYGMNYDSAWRHPLTPYTKKEEGIQLPVHPGLDGITYRHWLGLVFQDPDTARTPALVIREFYTRKLPRHQGLRIWAFGYDMDNMKARSWHESVMPLVLVDDEIREAFTAGVSCLVRASRESAAIIREAIKKVWFKPGATARGDLSLPDQRFWQDTEPDFFAALETLARQLSAGEDGETVRKAWQGTLKRSCERLFHELANTRMIEQQDPKRIALSWQMMQKRLHGPKLRGMLSI